ncbi:MAG: glycoside hydrolase family 2 TIM barrel-domain containing protein [Rikenellaceae bacterium]
MRKYILALTLAIASLGAASANSPLVENITARDGITLDGKWRYIIDPLENGYYDYRLRINGDGFFRNRTDQAQNLVEYDFNTSEQINVPGDWNSQVDELFVYEGNVWYEKDFNITKDDSRRYIIYFGAINYHSIVYVNGKRIGEHTGGYTSFNFDITDQIKDGDNHVVVKVDNRRHKDNVPTVNMDWWNYGGITRSVYVVSLPAVGVDNYTVELAKENEIAFTAELNKAQSGVEVRFAIPELKIDETVLTNSEGKVSIDVKSKQMELWSPSSPKLYDVEISASGETLNDRVGFRTIETKGTSILLNGEPIFLKGVSIHEEAPYGMGRAWSAEQATTILGWAKEMGCNYVRLAHYPHNEFMVRKAEEMGLMVWSEIPVYWTISWENETTYQNAEAQLCEMISRDKNRCGIVIWSIANETPHSDARDTFLSRLATKAREMDDSRLLSMAMEVTSAKDGVNTLNDNMNKYVDVVSFNQYVGWYRDTNAAALTMKWDIPYGKPIIISEFGGGALQGRHGDKSERWTEEYQEDLYKCNLVMLDKIEGLAGMSPWILVDFRSPRRQLPDIQDFYNRKGLISERGARKKAFFVMQDYYKRMTLSQE